MEAVVINDKEAILFTGRRQLRLFSSDGKVRDLVMFMMMPTDVNPDCKSPEVFIRAQASMSEDTVEINLEEVA